LDTRVSSITHFGKIAEVLYVRRVEGGAPSQLRKCVLDYPTYGVELSMVEHENTIFSDVRVTSMWIVTI
jgi:hypothetical protein